jgi:hypothetical protein
MKSFARIGALLGLVLVGTSCVTYSGVSKSPQGELYISGATNYFVFSQPWIRRCEVDGMKLNCVELSESPQAAPGTTGATAAPAPSGEPSATAAPEAPPAPEAKPAPTKSKK